MKKSGLFLLLSLLGWSICTAQTNPDKASRYTFGLISGFSSLGAYQSGASLKNVKGGFAGMELGYILASKVPYSWSLHFQPNWEKMVFDAPQTLYTKDLMFQSLNFPLLLRRSFYTNKKAHPFLEVGLQYRMRLKSTRKVEEIICPIATPCYVYRTTEEDLLPGGAKERFVWLAGAGVEVQLGALQIPVSVRFSEGVGTYSFQSGRYDRYPVTNLKTRVLQLVAGVNF